MVTTSKPVLAVTPRRGRQSDEEFDEMDDGVDG
jgi:hypothetical protein